MNLSVAHLDALGKKGREGKGWEEKGREEKAEREMEGCERYLKTKPK